LYILQEVKEERQAKTLDTFSWGYPPVPPFPSGLAALWSNEVLPQWLTAEVGLREGATVRELGFSFWKAGGHVTPRLEHYVTFLVKSRGADLKNVRCFERPWPQGLQIRDIAFGARSKNLLGSLGYLDQPDALMETTFGKLLGTPGLGIRSLIEIVTLVEAAIEVHWQVTVDLAQSIGFATDGASVNSRASEALPVVYRSGEEIGGKALLEAMKEPWMEWVGSYDPRFRSLLPLGEGTLDERIEKAISDPAAAASDLPRLIHSFPSIKKMAEHIQGCSLEESLYELLAEVVGSQRDLEVVTKRFGWKGEDPRTLQECGSEIGVTRERVRQIEAKVRRRIGSTPLYMPKLDEAISLLESVAPVSVTAAAELLHKRGISTRPFSSAAVIETAGILNRRTALSISDLRGQRLVVTSNQERLLGSVIRIARGLAGQAGVGSVYQVVDSLDATEEINSFLDIPNSELSEEDVRRILRGHQPCEFLNEDWFWFTDLPDGRNRLENVTKRILCVASPQTIGSVREGVRRVFHYRSITNPRYRTLVLPPQAVMARFFERHPDFRVDGENVGLVKGLDYRQLLGDGERAMVDVLRASSLGVMDRKSLVDQCAEKGINENTLSIYTSYSPILEHVGVDLWKLRGVRVDPAAIEAVRKENQLRPKETRMLDFGWDPNGKLWIGWRLPPLRGNIVLGIPAAVERYVVGRTFRATPKGSERALGQISVTTDGTSYGYNAFLRYIGADEGDTLRAEFDLASSTVELSIADSNSLGD
jgi:hypothetical protein